MIVSKFCSFSLVVFPLTHLLFSDSLIVCTEEMAAEESTKQTEVASETDSNPTTWEEAEAILKKRNQLEALVKNITVTQAGKWLGSLNETHEIRG